MKKNYLLPILLFSLSSCGGVDIGNDSSSSSDDHSITTDNSTNGIYTCSYACEPTEDTEGFSESFDYEGGADDCLELVESLGESCMVVEEDSVELPVIELTDDDSSSSSSSSSSGFNF